jgi:hypothetical protein
MASTVKKREGNVRLNIYLPSAGLRRLVKAAAAKRDVSISEYCARAITNQLKRDREESPAKETRASLARAVESARRFQADTFRGKTFKVSSADLIRQTREQRPA